MHWMAYLTQKLKNLKTKKLKLSLTTSISKLKITKTQNNKITFLQLGINSYRRSGYASAVTKLSFSGDEKVMLLPNWQMRKINHIHRCANPLSYINSCYFVICYFCDKKSKNLFLQFGARFLLCRRPSLCTGQVRWPPEL